MTPEQYFDAFRKDIIGIDQEFETACGLQKLVYADWIASGRLYRPIENIMTERVGPFIGNTHTETSEVGKRMTNAYHLAHKMIKEHVNAGKDDVILTTGFGMTAALVKFQRILGLKSCGQLSGRDCLKEQERPVIFLTHMEHHSNHTTWCETVADVVVIEPGKDLLVDLGNLEKALIKYKDRKRKIGSFTACSNVTGIRTPYHKMAALMHRYGGLAFIDFAASAPYEPMNMHPEDPAEKLDAIFFSPHKFLGGPGASGVLIFDSSLYKIKSPDQPGGGTVDWTNPWGEYKFIDNIELREDGGTPGFLQAMRTAMAITVKNRMGTEMIRQREQELLKQAFAGLRTIPGLNILADNTEDRLGVISFYFTGIHYNLVVKYLSDRFGIQVRGGCACAGTYGHYLLDVTPDQSKKITDKINRGDLSEKPGWVRLSLHPTMTSDELAKIIDALREIGINHTTWLKEYTYNYHTNEFRNIREINSMPEIESWLMPEIF